MAKNISIISWLGKAAHEVMQLRDLTGAEAHADARRLERMAVECGYDLRTLDATKFVRLVYYPATPLPPQQRIRQNAAKSPKTKASWIGKAAYEYRNKLGCSGKAANRYAQNLASDFADYGVDLLRIDPVKAAQGHLAR